MKTSRQRRVRVGCCRSGGATIEGAEACPAAMPRSRPLSQRLQVSWRVRADYSFIPVQQKPWSLPTRRLRLDPCSGLTGSTLAPEYRDQSSFIFVFCFFLGKKDPEIASFGLRSRLTRGLNFLSTSVLPSRPPLPSSSRSVHFTVPVPSVFVVGVFPR